MLRSLRHFFDTYLSPDTTAAQDTEQSVRLATAALLVEMARMDETIAPPEQDRIGTALQKLFCLTSEQSAALQQPAQQAAEAATSYHEFTALLNKHFDTAQKIRVIEYLWEVAYADCQLDKYEEHFVRKIADLLYVSHSDFIAAKLRVLARRDAE